MCYIELTVKWGCLKMVSWTLKHVGAIIKMWFDICRTVHICWSIKGSVYSVLRIYIGNEKRPCENQSQARESEFDQCEEGQAEEYNNITPLC